MSTHARSRHLTLTSRYSPPNATRHINAETSTHVDTNGLRALH